MLLDTVESVLRGDRVPGEIVVIDQSDVPHEVLADYVDPPGCAIRYRSIHAIGVSAARNTGAAAATHELLIFIDDDMIAARTWLGTLVEALVRLGTRGVVTGQVAPAEADTVVPSVKVDPGPALYEGRLHTDVLYTGNMALYRDTLTRVGGFDDRLGPGTRFPAAEDNDLGLRLLEAGHSIAYVPDAVLYHRAWRSRRENVMLRWKYGRGQGAFYAKHLHLHDPYTLRRMVTDIVVGLRSVIKTVVVRPYDAAAEGLYVLGLLMGAAGWLWRYASVQRPALGTGSRGPRR